MLILLLQDTLISYNCITLFWLDIKKLMNFFGLHINFRSAKNSLLAFLQSNTAMLESRNNAMLLSTVYRCVDLVSDSVAVLPLKLYSNSNGYKTEDIGNSLHYILNIEPNANMSRFVFFKTLMVSVLLRGNGFAIIHRDRELNVTALEYVPSSEVTIGIVESNGEKRKIYRVNGHEEDIEDRDMIHVLNFSYDGINGVSTLTHAAQTLKIATKSEEQAVNFFDGGATNGILSVEGARLSKEQREQIYNQWYERIGDKKNGVAVLEGNMRYQPISISPKDAQLLESRQFNVLDICRFFSVSPIKAFDLSKSSYATVEATQNQYLVDTVQPVITKIELELMRKVLLPSQRGKKVIEFDTSVILRTDKSAQASYWKDMFYIGAVTPNEIRKESNLPRIEDGDNLYIPVNVQRINQKEAVG